MTDKPAKFDPNKVKIIEHSGYQYEVDKVLAYVDAGMSEKQAVRQAYPELPAKSVQPLLSKIKKSPYYIAKKDVETSILAAKGAELQNNLLDLAFNARSEMVRLGATDSGLDRIYGKKEEELQIPTMTFNFSFGDNQTTVKVKPDAIEGEVVDG